eukprot:CAMPEP_0194031158 /NCGR_PEP_ID=MMETSP0009_2-20130614/4406_1 /TAXON_ID=210454 /ORGANISM="Grammatophora oceanica, Strain CCMP 410" /LENGTH=281 /DNA_ID=CAMNT_0038671241 /DNA_START=59 /DNA_END=904 /DNA_ORIENTATION=-
MAMTYQLCIPSQRLKERNDPIPHLDLCYYCSNCGSGPYTFVSLHCHILDGCKDEPPQWKSPFLQQRNHQGQSTTNRAFLVTDYYDIQPFSYIECTGFADRGLPVLPPGPDLAACYQVVLPPQRKSAIPTSLVKIVCSDCGAGPILFGSFYQHSCLARQKRQAASTSHFYNNNNTVSRWFLVKHNNSTNITDSFVELQPSVQLQAPPLQLPPPVQQPPIPLAEENAPEEGPERAAAVRAAPVGVVTGKRSRAAREDRDQEQPENHREKRKEPHNHQQPEKHQ